MKLVTSAHMQQIDHNTQSDFSVSGESLMESAALSGWNMLCDWLEQSVTTVFERREALFVCGKGNNAGDALVMARYAALSGWKADLLLCVSAAKIGELTGRQLEACNKLGVSVFEYEADAHRAREAISAAPLIVDGLAGTGISGRLRSPMDEAVEHMNASNALVAAIDTPSGISDEWRAENPTVEAAVTLSMGLPKRCLYQPKARSRCGQILHVPVPFPRELTEDPRILGELRSAQEIAEELPALREGAYKNTRGTVTAFAGERGKAGASMLAAEAALASRAGLVHLVVDPDIYSSVASAEKAVMVHPRSPRWERKPSYECLLIGCGWGTKLQRMVLLPRLIERASRGVIDADGLNLLAKMAPRKLGPDWVLTPHIGELARLTACTTEDVGYDLIGAACEAASRWGCVVVGKSHVVTVATPDGRHLVVDGMNAAMGTGGTGDVLAGAISGLLANGLCGVDAATYGVALHQRAGQSLRSADGFFSADQLIRAIQRLTDRRPS